MRKEITDILTRIGADYIEREKISSFEIAQEHDVHAFYRLAKTDRVVHVQGYPGLSTRAYLHLSLRLKAYSTMLQERLKGNVSIGNEHLANIEIIQGVPNQVRINSKQDIKEIQNFLEKYFAVLR